MNKMMSANIVVRLGKTIDEQAIDQLLAVIRDYPDSIVLVDCSQNVIMTRDALFSLVDYIRAYRPKVRFYHMFNVVLATMHVFSLLTYVLPYISREPLCAPATAVALT